jgi:lipopolysaccharide transport system ATP-binding protein
MTDTAIQVDHVWKKFRRGEFHDSLRELIPAMARRAIGRGRQRDQLDDREFWALHDVSFEVKRGQSMGIIGPNGAGKSTMLKLLSRIIRPNRGTYKVNGRLSALIEVGAGFHGDLTGRENIFLNGAILGMKRREIAAKLDQIIDFAGIDRFIDTPVKRYSSGMGARLGFAVAAHLDPEVLLVDEVLSVGDAKFRNKCIRHMHELIKGDVTVVFISHLLNQVRALCPQTLVLDQGQVIFHGDTDEAVRVYMEALGDDPTGATGDEAADAEIRNIHLCDEGGDEQLHWQYRKPGIVEFDLVLHRDVERPSVLINVSSLSGVYLGTANSLRSYMDMPTRAGTYRMRFALDPMPLVDGDYTLEFVVRDGDEQQHLLWQIRHPYTVSIRGGGFHGGVIAGDGMWQVVEATPAPPTVAPTPHLTR